MELAAATKQQHRLAALYFAAVAVAFCLIGWWTGRGEGSILGAPFCDMPASFMHWRQWGFGWLARGVIPHWNPHVFCGTPFLAHTEAALFYPPNWTFLLLPVGVGVNLGVVLHLWLAGFGTWLLCRRLELSSAPALLAGTAFMLSGPVTARIFAGHANHLAAMAWMPMLLTLTEGIVRGFASSPASPRTGLQIALAAGAYAAAILAGHPQAILYISISIGIYALFRVAVFPFRQAMLALAGVGAMPALGLLLAAVQLIPTLLRLPEGSRQALSFQVVASSSVPPWGFAELFLPAFFGDLVRSPWWGVSYPWEMAMYAGLPTLVLAAAALACLRKGDRHRNPVAAFATLAALFAVLTLGAYTPILGLLYRFVPGFGLFRGTSKMLPELVLPLAMLAAFGMEALIANDRGRRTLAVALAVVLGTGVAVAGVAIWLGNGDGANYVRAMESVARTGDALEVNPETFRLKPIVEAVSANLAKQATGFAVVAILTAVVLGARFFCNGDRRWKAAVVAVALGDLVMANRHHAICFDPDKAVPAFSVASGQRQYRVGSNDPAFSANSVLAREYYAVDGFEPIFPRLHGELINALNGSKREFYNSVPDLRAPGPMTGVVSLGMWWEGSELTPIANPIPRVSGYTKWRVVMDSNESWKAIADRSFDPREEVVVEGTSNVPLPDTQAANEPVPINWEQRNPNTILATVVASKPTLVVVSDTWHTGWTATVDGVATPILRSNHAMKAVFVSPGSHQVALQYRAPGFALGAIVSLVSLGLTVLLGWRCGIRGRGRSGAVS